MLLRLEQRIEIPETRFDETIGRHFLKAHFHQNLSEGCTDVEKWGNLAEIMMGRCFSEDRLEWAHSVWHFLRRKSVSGEAARRSLMNRSGNEQQKKMAFEPSNIDDMMLDEGRYDQLSLEEKEGLNERAVMPLPHLRMVDVDPDDLVHVQQNTATQSMGRMFSFLHLQLE